MTEDTLLPFDLPAVRRKKVTADFEGGLVLLRGAERRLGLAETLAGCIREWRDPALVVHTLPAMLRFRIFAIACGYNALRCFLQGIVGEMGVARGGLGLGVAEDSP